MKLSCLIVEDEVLAANALVRLISETPGLELLGQAATGPEAVREIDRLTPDVLFLDIRIPVFSGVQVLERIRCRPRVVFTTAYDDYAVAAFELGALDYLLKPFGKERFTLAVSRLLERSGTQESSPDCLTRWTETAGASGTLRRLFVRRGKRILPVSIEGVSRFEAMNDYVAVWSEGQRHLINLSLNELEARLDPQAFLRVHRSCIVNLERVASMSAHDSRRLELRLDDGAVVIASRSGSQALRRLVV